LAWHRGPYGCSAAVDFPIETSKDRGYLYQRVKGAINASLSDARAADQMISAAMNKERQILHLQPFRNLSFGEQNGRRQSALRSSPLWPGAKFEALAVDNVMQES